MSCPRPLSPAQQECYQVKKDIQSPNIKSAFSHDVADGYLTHDRLLAGVAASLLSCVDTLAAHVGLEVAEHRIQLILLERLALSRMVEMSRVGLGDVNASLRALGGQRALRALGGLVGLRVRRVGHRLMLMGAAINLQRHADRRIERIKIREIEIVSEVRRGRFDLDFVVEEMKQQGIKNKCYFPCSFSDIPMFAFLKCEKNFLNLEIDDLNFSENCTRRTEPSKKKNVSIPRVVL